MSATSQIPECLFCLSFLGYTSAQRDVVRHFAVVVLRGEDRGVALLLFLCLTVFTKSA
jgi:hypothetical protein